MKYRHLKWTCFAGLVLCFGCSQAETQNLSIEGIWTCTPETALDYPESRLITALLIEKSKVGNFEARGCFMWGGSYHHSWELEEALFNNSSQILTLLDDEGDRYEGMLGPDKQSIRGYFWSDDPDQTTPLDTIDFIRADPELAEMLFFPRTTGSNTEANYIIHPAHIETLKVDIPALSDLMSEIIAQKYGRLESLLVMKDSMLVLEEYFYGYERSRLHNVHSVTKSIASLLLGIVMEQHKEVELTLPLFEFFPEYDTLARDGKELISLEHLLTMTAGFPVDEVPGWIDLEDQVLNILSRPMSYMPGEVFEYNNDNSILLGGIFQNITSEPADQLVEKYLFDPMGISNYQWAYVSGLPQCHSDLQMLPRDMAKIGQLVLNDGRWGNQQLVPKEWIRESTRVQVQESEFFDYGYHWWHRAASNKPWWEVPERGSNEEHEIVIALGYGGQYIMIIRDLKMVVVTTASDYANGQTARSKIPMVIEKLIPLFE